MALFEQEEGRGCFEIRTDTLDATLMQNLQDRILRREITCI